MYYINNEINAQKVSFLYRAYVSLSLLNIFNFFYFKF